MNETPSIPTDIASQLRRDEGVRAHPYTDTNGKLTIGVGRNLSAKGLTGNEIDFLLENDIREMTIELNARLPWYRNLDPVRQAVFQNMAFNIGIRGLENFPQMLIAAAKGHWEDVVTEMLDSEWAKEVGGRALRLANQIRTGEWT